LPLSVAERDFDLALREWRSVVGPANVVDSSPGLDGYRDAYSPLEDNAPQASAAVLPNSVEQVQEVMRIASRYGVPVWPISTGRNLAYGGAAPRISHRVTSVEQTGESAVVHADTPNGPVSIAAPWVIGCDGAGSAVRISQNIEFEGYTWPERFLLIHTKEDFSDLYGRVNFIADGPKWQLVVRIPYGPGPDDWLFRVVSSVPEGMDVAEAASPEALQENLRRLRPEKSEFPVANWSIYNVHQRVAKTYRQGRVLLVGDAAHVNNPMGGQGLNSGIHDALNFAGKFKQVWADPGKDALLDLYDRQRRITNWEYIQKISVENKQRNEETDPAARRGNIDFLNSLKDNDDARFGFLHRWSMGESLDFAESVQ